MTKRKSSATTFSSNKRTKRSNSSRALTQNNITLGPEEYKSIAAAIEQAIAENNFKKAFKLAKKAADLFKTPGYMLLASLNYKKVLSSKTIRNEVTRKRFLKETLININLARKLMATSNLEILEASKWEITEENLIKFGVSCGKKFTFFKEADEKYVTKQTKQRFDKIHKPEISEPEPVDSPDLHP